MLFRSVLLFVKLFQTVFHVENNENICDKEISKSNNINITDDVDKNSTNKTSTSTSFTTSLSTIGSIIIDQSTTYRQLTVMLDSLFSSHSNIFTTLKQEKIGETSDSNKNQNTETVPTDSLFYSFVHKSPVCFSEFTRAELESRSEQLLNSAKIIKQVAYCSYLIVILILPLLD